MEYHFEIIYKAGVKYQAVHALMQLKTEGMGDSGI